MIKALSGNDANSVSLAYQGKVFVLYALGNSLPKQRNPSCFKKDELQTFAVVLHLSGEQLCQIHAELEP